MRVLDVDQLALVAAYEADRSLLLPGATPELLRNQQRRARLAARRFCRDIGGAEAWSSLSLEAQLRLEDANRLVVAWLLATGRAAATAGYLVRARTFVGAAFARYHPEFFAEFTTTALALGARGRWERRQWGSLAMASAIHAVGPQALTAEQLVSARDQLRQACRAADRPEQGERLSAGVFQARTTLFHLGLLSELPAKREPDGGRWRRGQWEPVAPGLADTLLGYLDQLALTRRPATVRQAEGTLREFALFLARTSPEVGRLADVRRSHVEGYRHWLSERPAHHQQRPVTRKTQAKRLATLGQCFERVTDWGWPDAPQGRLVSRADLPIPDRPLPRFIDDGAAARLMAAARSADDPFDRLAVEFLARTGLRVGELLDLTVDAVVQIGSSFWLRVPVGKLHDDR